MRFWPALVAQIVILGLFASASAGPEAAGELIGVRFGPHPDKTRIVLDVSAPIDWRAQMVEADGGKRLVLDIERVEFAGPHVGPAGVRAIKDYQFGTAGPTASEIVFDLAETMKIDRVFAIPASASAPNNRIVIDIKPATDAEWSAALGRAVGDFSPPIAVAAVEPPPAPSLKSATGVTAASLAVATVAPPPADVQDVKRVIVIDAGHGGHDPGAIGPKGTREKTVTLAAAKALSEALEKTGRYRVQMTRDDDTFLDLAERADFARQSNADLFISLHADSIGDSKIRGASVYTLDGGDRALLTRRVREDGNFFDIEHVPHTEEVNAILADIVVREKANESGRFASILIDDLASSTMLLNNSHRRASLGVLKSPDVPAVLLELAFISNASDEANLLSARWRAKTVKSVVQAIDDYFEQRPPIRQAQVGLAN